MVSKVGNGKQPDRAKPRIQSVLGFDGLFVFPPPDGSEGFNVHSEPLRWGNQQVAEVGILLESICGTVPVLRRPGNGFSPAKEIFSPASPLFSVSGVRWRG